MGAELQAVEELLIFKNNCLTNNAIPIILCIFAAAMRKYSYYWQKSLIKEMKKYVKPTIKEMELETQPILAGSSIEPSGPIGEGW